MLIEAGADVNLKTKDGWSALMFASFAGNVKTCVLLISNRADVNVVNSDGYTPLNLAVKTGNAELIKIMIDNNANINANTGYWGTALNVAVANDNYDAVKLLLENEANKEMTGKSGKTALMIAAMKGNFKIVKLLMIYGAEVNAVNKKGFTALDYALGNDEMITLLKQYGANKKSVTDYGKILAESATAELIYTQNSDVDIALPNYPAPEKWIIQWSDKKIKYCTDYGVKIPASTRWKAEFSSKLEAEKWLEKIYRGYKMNKIVYTGPSAMGSAVQIN